MPDVQRFAVDCELFGAQGITVHPRPDERHIRKEDVYQLKAMVTTELNVEGNPTEEFLALVSDIRPTQVTLVPDSPEQLTSNHGWDTKANLSFLTDVAARFREAGIRTSIFIDALPEMADYAKQAGADRIELYTEPYAAAYSTDREVAVRPFVETAAHSRKLGLGVNAGHDLSLQNLAYFHHALPCLDEVSIGHALISDALYLGIEETIRQYLLCIKNKI